ncbi:MAG: sulfotransferase, partial [Nitrospinota bacterium]|nr:sulfotransferase [Nitrospinota bacterium]
MEDSPLFIIGNPRSGTTLLRLMLTCHPNICIPPESGFMIDLYKTYYRCQVDSKSLQNFITDVLSSQKMETWKITE